MQQHFIEFYSPGTFISETNQVPCKAWDIEEAKQIATSTMQRHGARPFGFRFVTYERSDDELNAHRGKSSGLYYLGGQILTLEEIEARGDPQDEILLRNMRIRGIAKIVENRNSYLFTGPLEEGDEVLDFTMPQIPEASPNA